MKQVTTHRRLFALLVGIDAYPAPVPPLQGCRKDVARIRQYLESWCGQSADPATNTQNPQLHLRSLEDQEATYTHIIRGFREHLSQAGPDDLVWFHFSGHGTESWTAPAFQERIEPGGKDQNLVCYTPPTQEEPDLLADKELAILLHEVATANGSGRPPHLVVSLDCCHSGSGTRDAHFNPELRTRALIRRKVKNWQAAADRGITRPLASYLDGHFQDKGLHLPVAQHLLLSACTSTQTAADLPQGGIFTTGLIQALERSRGQISYADLFVRTRARVKQLRREQLPQFETIGSFNPYTRFLDGSPFGNPDQFQVVAENGQWLVKCGAIHGLPSRPAQAIQLDIYEQAGQTPLGQGQIASIGAQKSQLRIPPDLHLDTGRSYRAVLRHLPAPPVYVLLQGDPPALQLLQENWDTRKNMHWIGSEEEDAAAMATIRLEASAGDYRLYAHDDDRLVLQLPQSGPSLKRMQLSIQKMARWERTLQLEHPKSAIQDRVELLMDIQLKGGRINILREEQAELVVSEQDFNRHQDILYAAFFPKVQIHDTSQQLFCYLLHMRSDYSILMRESPVIFRPVEHVGQSSLSLPLWKEGMGWGLGPTDQEAFACFKLIVTTEELDYQQLLQSGIDGDRDADWAWEPLGVTDEWCSKTMNIRLRRAEIMRTTL